MVRAVQKKGLALAFLALLITAQPARGAKKQIFFSDFDKGVPAEFSGVTHLDNVQGFQGKGKEGSAFNSKFLHNTSALVAGKPNEAAGKTSLTLTNLPAHSHVDISFLLAVIDSWDGIYHSVGGYLPPDFFNVDLNGSSLFHRHFDNFSRNDQSSVTPDTEIFYGQDLYLNAYYFPDSAYHMGLDPAFRNIPHTSESLIIDWYASGSGWQGSVGDNDESWAIDNVGVALTLVPEPTTLSLAGLGLLGVSGFARRKKTG